MNRLERISAILVKLQSRPVVTASEIAEQFGVSLRTVYRDIRALEESGIPVGGEAGVGIFAGGRFQVAAPDVQYRGGSLFPGGGETCQPSDPTAIPTDCSAVAWIRYVQY